MLTRRRALRWLGRAVLVALSVAVFAAAYIAMVADLPPTPVTATRTAQDAMRIPTEGATMPTRPVFLALAAAALLASAGCGQSGGDAQAAPAPTTTTSTLDKATEIECANVERAYNAWEWTPSRSTDYSDFNLRLRHEDGENFLEAVDGYKDKGATALSLEIARLNLDVALTQGMYAAVGSATSDQTTKIADGVKKVKAAYKDFQKSTCGQ